MRRIRFTRKTGTALIALALSLLVCAQPATPLVSAAHIETGQPDAAARIHSVQATAVDGGVLIEWRTSYELNNVGFYLYRQQDGHRLKVNESIVPGSVLILGDGVALRTGNAYSAFDAAGTANARYDLESIDLHGKITRLESIPVLSSRGMKRPLPSFRSDFKTGEVETNGSNGTQVSWPAAQANESQAAGSVADQWQIAAQSALKIGVRQTGWYRLTQSQIISAGLDPNTDARNLRLFVDGQEVAIRVSRESGPLASSDFLEFYGVGLDVPWSDKQIYWLTGGTQAGKRIPVFGEAKHDGSPGPTKVPPAASPVPALTNFGRFITLPGEWPMPRTEASPSSAQPRLELKAAHESEELDVPVKREVTNQPAAKKIAPASIESETEKTSAGKPATAVSVASAKEANAPAATTKSVPSAARARTLVSRTRSRRGARKVRKSFRRRQVKKNHATVVAEPAAFLQTVTRQERLNYFSSMPNGEAENFFGQVLVSGSPTTQTLTLTNIETSASNPAQIEVALQGIGVPAHYDVFFNDVKLGTMTAVYRDHPVATFAFPLTSLREGSNDIKFVPLAGSGISFVDYVRVTYPHRYRAENNSLRFSARFTQTVRVDGFTSANVRVLDVTDPSQIVEVKPIVETSGPGYAITIPPVGARTKGSRALLAFVDGVFQQPAAITLNVPSNLNATSNGAELVVISHAAFMPSAVPLINQRIGQGLPSVLVDVEDVYDEFGYGRHTPYALRDFLSHAGSSWSTKPRYAILLGDASADPRNYQSIGSFDFVPTKIIDTFYLETASDDWLTDLDGDGIGEIALGRLPARTVSEAGVLISKIVNFLPANVPQSALLVADAQGNYYFNFEAANAAVEALLPPSMNVETVNRRTEPSDAAAQANIIAKINAGQALVNYSGHGNINAWAGSILTSSDALALTNGNKLSFMVVMDCLNGYFIEPRPLGEGLAESFLKAPNGGGVAAFASSGETLPDGQHDMSQLLYQLLYGGTSIPLGDAIKQAKTATVDLDVRRTWIFFGDPSMKIR